MKFFRWVLFCVVWAAPSYAFAQWCWDVCPPATDCMTECNIAPGEPELCWTWCELNGPCTNCPPPSCPDSCGSYCAQPGRQCNDFCTYWDGVSCQPNTCGLAGYDTPGCTQNSDWFPVGPEYDCCNGTDSCRCQLYEYREFTCTGDTCGSLVTGAEYTDMFGCTTCDDGNPCTLNNCNAGVCDFSGESGYSQACYTGPAGTQNVGVCAGGTETCSGGAFGPCVGEVTPAAEICGGGDEDCDGTVDEGCGCPNLGDIEPCYDGPPGTLGVGQCSQGFRECRDDIPCVFPNTQCWTECAGQVTPTAEVCDNLDNNCDGTVDGILEACYTGPPATREVGICTEGVRACTAGAWSACSGEVTPAATETCGNGLDDDCDGVVDNGCPTGCAGPEICDGLDNDCDGIIDEDIPLLMGTTCVVGAIFDTCDMMTCPMGEVCMQPAGYCSADPTGCTGSACPPGTTCQLGNCYEDSCTGHAMCDPANSLCYNNNLCLNATDPCAGMNCPVGQFCYKGGCYDPCAGPADCTMPLLCYDGRCASDPCTAPNGTPVACPIDQICYGGNCFDPCTLDNQCGPNSFCPAGRCAETNCQNVQCPVGEVCQGGNCMPGCSLATCTPPEVCFAETFCAVPTVDLCATAQCGQKPCHKGICYDACMVDADCPAGQRCHDDRCVDLVAGACDGVLCPAGEACLGGDCFPDCSQDADCTNPGSFCYQQVCVDPVCTLGKCQPNEVCHRGVCFLECDGMGNCPNPLSCFDGDGPARCAPSACEAMDSVAIASYNASHPFRVNDQRLRSFQQNRPWNYPRPYRITSGTPQAWTQIAGTFSSHPMHGPAIPIPVVPPAVPVSGSPANVSFVYNTANDSYSLYLSHGSLDPGQGGADAVYSIHIDGAEPNVLITDDEGAEAFERSGSGDTRHIQALISTNGAETGGILIGPFDADDDWTMEIYAAFYGPGITSWRLMNGEDGPNGSTQQVLDPYYPLIIRNEEHEDDEYLDPTIGTNCDVRSARGICSQGTWLDCRNHRRSCYQTVYGMGGELCNGEDDNCNGQVDELNHMVVPTVQYRQHPNGYRQWLTYDTFIPVAGETHNSTSNHPLNYTPHSSDDRLGYVTINLPFDGAVQENTNQSHVFAHRNLKDGRITFPFVHGKSEAMAIWAQRNFEMDIEPLNNGEQKDISVPWYEDRKPGGTADSIFRDYEDDEAEARFRVGSRGGVVETDTLVLGVRPLTQLDWTTANPERRGFRVEFDYPGINPYDWLLRWPGNVTSLNTQRKLRVRVRPTHISDAFCRSPNPTGTCNIGKYACIGGGLRCSPANNAYCSGCRDNDGDMQDGYDPVFCPTGTDCDDDDDTVYLGAPELCDGKDNSCNGLVDQTTDGCPGGSAICGPVDCGYRNVCICPENASCYCGEGLGR